MLANRVVFALLLAVCGTSGCATVERWPLFQSATAPKVAPVPPPGKEFFAPASTVPQPTTPSVAVIEPPVIAEIVESLGAAVVDDVEPATPAARIAESPQPKSQRPEAKNETSKIKSRPATATAPTPTSLLADNRLLDLLEKDLDKAVEQPPERRRLQFSKEVAANPKVRHFVRHYSTTAKRHFQELLERSGKYLPMIAKVLNQEGLPEELGYLALLESEFIIDSTSPSGAVGLWQFVAGTARSYGLRIDEWVDERRDPVKSTRAAAAYLKDLHDRYGRWFLATAAYNAGPGTINRAMKTSGAKDFWSLSQKASLSEETRNFVPKFIAIALIAGDPQSYGFHEIEYAPPLDYEAVELPWSVTLATLASLADSDTATLRELNPALVRNTTPPGEPGFRVNLPVGKAEIFLAKADEKFRERKSEPVQILTHEVRKGETLLSIARRYGQQVRALMELNGLTTASLRIGQKIRILLSGIPALR
jgi:membrane-bound lytic murein transglycosylase D